ncbi:MAG: xylulokinase [Actinomycetota bacterium]
MVSELVVGVDSSTQSTKVEVRTLDEGRLVGRGAADHPVVQPPCAEQEPDAWWQAFDRALVAALGGLAAPTVVAVAVAGQQHGMVALDRDDQPVHPAKLWNDTESSDDAVRLTAELGAEGWAAAVGSVPVSAFTITKLAWLRRTQRSAFDRIAHVLLPHDELTRRLTGEYTTDRGDASGTGYWSAPEGRYRFDLLELVDPDVDWSGRLPLVLGPADVAGIAAHPRIAGAVVGAGTGDNMAAALGIGVRAGEGVISIGTSGTAYAVVDSPTSDPAGEVAGFADATGRFLPLVCTSNAGRVLDAIRRLLGVDPAELDRLALHVDESPGPTLLPYFDGERTPNRPGAHGVLAGLRSDVTREQLARAAVDGVAFGLLDALDSLRRVGPRVERLVLTGGGSRSAALAGTIAAGAGCPVELVDLDEAVAAGAAVQAAAAVGGVAPEEVAARWGLGVRRRVEPAGDRSVDERRAAYAELRAATDRAPWSW